MYTGHSESFREGMQEGVDFLAMQAKAKGAAK
jgi:hypothetical protein